MMQKYRRNVAAMISFQDLWLGCLRSSGVGWQCVQGGLEPHDLSTDDALLRELREELGISPECVRIRARSSCWRRYVFPSFVRRPDPDDFLGQDQLWHVVELTSLESVQLHKSDGEFQEVKLMAARELYEKYVPWKKFPFYDFCCEQGVL